MDPLGGRPFGLSGDVSPFVPPDDTGAGALTLEPLKGLAEGSGEEVTLALDALCDDCAEFGDGVEMDAFGGRVTLWRIGATEENIGDPLLLGTEFGVEDTSGPGTEEVPGVFVPPGLDSDSEAEGEASAVLAGEETLGVKALN